MLTAHLRLSWMVWLLCCLSVGVPILHAQSPASSPPPRSESMAPAVNGSEATRSLSRQYDVIYLKNRDGEIVPVILGPTLEQVLDRIDASSNPAEPAPPRYSFTNVKLQGTADIERASITATVQVKVHDDQGFVLVPFRMNEATLRDFKHAGPGPSRFDHFDAETGYRWWLSGEGLHTLTLELSVPIRRELPTRRLQLSLPSAAVSDLLLSVPQLRLTAKADDRSKISWNSVDGVHSEISLIGLGNRLDLTWQPQPDLGGVETVLESRTSISVSIDGESILLEANQRVLALQGVFSEFRVRLPIGYELLKIEGTAYKEHKADPDSLNLITVSLKEPGSGPVDLKWTCRAELESTTDPIPLEGFEVERARIQTGNLAVRLVGAYRVAQVDNAGRYVQRINFADLAKVVPPIPSQGDVVSAYRILRQPFRLVLNLQQVEPYLTVKPYQFVKLSSDRAEYLGIFQFQVFRGGVDEVILNWPNWQAEGWQIEPVDAPGRVEQTLVDESSPSGQIRIRLIEQNTGNLEFRLRAQRPLNPTEGPIVFTLPSAVASSQPSSEVVIAADENVEADFKPTGETSVRPLNNPLPESLTMPRWARDLQRSSFRVDSRASTFVSTMTVHKQRLSTQSEADLTIQERQLQIQQRIIYDVAYERLGQMLLMVPDELIDRCKFLSTSGAELIPTATGAREGSARQFRLTLEQPRLGRFEVVCQYSLERDDEMPDAPHIWPLPLVTSSDSEFTSSRLRVRSTEGARFTVPDESWKKQPFSSGVQTWMANGEKSMVSLLQEPLEPNTSRGVLVTKTLIRVAFDQMGQARCRAQFRVRGPFPSLAIKLPEGIESSTVWWDRKQIDKSRMTEYSGTNRTVQLRVPEYNVGSEHLLTIDYQLGQTTPFATTESHTVVVPQVASGRGEFTQTVCELVMPAKQHLFSSPAGFTPLFRWTRTGPIWQRHNSISADEASDWIGAADGPENTEITPNGLEYRFTYYGDVSKFNFRTMGQEVIVLIGAGLTLLVGFVLMYVRFTRHVLTILLLAFATTGVALVYPEPVFLLLQPAALGLVLAIVSAIIQGIVRRSRQSRSLTLTSPSGFMTPPSSVDQDYAVGVGSNEPTSIRMMSSQSS